MKVIARLHMGQIFSSLTLYLNALTEAEWLVGYTYHPAPRVHGQPRGWTYLSILAKIVTKLSRVSSNGVVVSIVLIFSHFLKRNYVLDLNMINP